MMIQPDVAVILEIWNERTAILEFEAGNNRTSSEVIARRPLRICCIAIVQAKRHRLETVRQLAAFPGCGTMISLYADSSIELY